MLYRCLLILLTLAWCTGASAQASLEIIELHHTHAQAILPVIRPLLKADEAATGQGNQLFLRLHPANRQTIMEVVKRLDKAPARLLISVRRSDQTYIRQRQLGADVDISNRDSHVTLEATQTRRQGDEGSLQQLQVMEGHSARIGTGRAIPLERSRLIITDAGVVSENAVEYVNIEDGFWVMPRLNGNQVTVEISAVNEREHPHSGGVIQTREVISVIRGPLNQWLDLGMIDSSAHSDTRGILSRTGARDSRSGRLQIRVERLP